MGSASAITQHQLWEHSGHVRRFKTVALWCFMMLVSGCGTAAPPKEGYITKCKVQRCADVDGEKLACSKIAPAGYFWEALPSQKVESYGSRSQICSFVLRRMVPRGKTKSGAYPATSAQPTGCHNDTECKGDRICVKGECVFPNDPPQGKRCVKDTDCPAEEICVGGHCSNPTSVDGGS